MTARAIDLESRHGAHNYHPLPVVLNRGEGVWLFDEQGRRYLDMMSAYSAVSFGHSHPALVKALTEQAGRLPATKPALRPHRLGAVPPVPAPAAGLGGALPMKNHARCRGRRP